jgi:alpha-galactosidase
VDTAHAEHLRANAHTWRMSGDLWDSWADIVGMFDLCRDWAPHSGEGHWPDADMLPLGQIANRSSEHGLGQRITRLSPDEQITMMSLWCIFGSPLMLGCDLRVLDVWTRDLLTNQEVLRMLRTAHGAREVLRGEGFIVWIAEADPNTRYLAVFNTGFTATTVALALSALDLPNRSSVTDLWAHDEPSTVAKLLVVEVSSHGARLFKVSTLLMPTDPDASNGSGSFDSPSSTKRSRHVQVAALCGGPERSNGG